MKRFCAAWAVLCLVVLPQAVFAGGTNDGVGGDLDREIRGAPRTGTERPVPPAQGAGQASLAPEFFIALDMIFESGFRRSDLAPNQGKIREIEFGYSGNIDPWFFGMVSFVLENEAGEYKADVHEAYLRWMGLGRGMALRAGKMFVEIGIMNTIHQHDRPFVDSPLVQREMFAYESVADFGLDFDWLLSFLPFYAKLNIGVYNGQVFGHGHSAGTAKPFPLLSSSLRLFFPLGRELGLRIGLNGLLRPLDDEDAALHARYFGLDLMLKGWQSKNSGITLQGEYWLRQREDNNQRKEGGYLLGTVKLASWLETGVRIDRLQTTAPVTVEAECAWSCFVTFRPSEFSLLRLQYQRLDTLTMSGAEDLLSVQASFILGAHPAHKY